MFTTLKTISKAGVLTGAALVVFASGCADVSGHWSLKEVSPTAAQRDFEYRTLTLHNDGSFYAEATKSDAKIRTTSGVYTYDHAKKTLHLEEHDGEAHTFDTTLKNSGTEMELARFWEGRKLEAKFEKQTQ